MNKLKLIFVFVMPASFIGIGARVGQAQFPLPPG